MRGYHSMPFKPRLLAFFIILPFTALNCSHKTSGRSSDQIIVPVSVAKVVEENVPFRLSAIGTVESIASVGVRSQVGGILAKVYFKEGQDINKGDMLFMIDPSQFEVQLRRAEASLKRDQTQLANAQVQNQRYQQLMERELISKEQYEQVQTQAETLKATVSVDQAEVDAAKLLVSYCYIRSPISGKAGSLNMHAGDVVKTDNSAAMVTINQLKPIYVSFAVSDRFLSEIKKYMGSGPLKVFAETSSQSSAPEEGSLAFIDNAVDNNTGTIRLKGVFENRRGNLWPGQFVNVTLDLYQRKDALVVPSQAVMAGQSGQYVYVVKRDMTVESRPVVTSMELDNNTLVDKGLSAGEIVVTDGQLQLTSGARIEIVVSPGEPSPGSTAKPNIGADGK